MTLTDTEQDRLCLCGTHESSNSGTSTMFGIFLCERHMRQVELVVADRVDAAVQAERDRLLAEMCLPAVLDAMCADENEATRLWVQLVAMPRLLAALAEERAR